MTDLERLAEQKVVVLNFKMKIASVALLMVSTFLAICSRVSLSNKRECQVWGMFSVTIFRFSFLPFFIEMSPRFC